MAGPSFAKRFVTDDSSLSGERPRVRDRISLARLPAEIPAVVLWEGLVLDGVITDLGMGGLFIECDEQTELAAAVIVCMPHPSGPLELLGTVRWNGERGMGIQFEPLGARETHILAEFLKYAPDVEAE